MNESNPAAPRETPIGEGSPSQERITDGQREMILDFLRKSENKSIGEDVALATPEEVALADGLLALDLSPNDLAPSNHAAYSEYHYGPELEAREAAFAAAGLPTDKTVETERHNFTLDRGAENMLPVKMINLVRVEQVPEPIVDEGGRQKGETLNTVHTPLPGGTLFLGKVTFDGPNGAERYVNLTDEERSQVRAFVERNAKQAA